MSASAAPQPGYRGGDRALARPAWPRAVRRRFGGGGGEAPNTDDLRLYGRPAAGWPRKPPSAPRAPGRHGGGGGSGPSTALGGGLDPRSAARHRLLGPARPGTAPGDNVVKPALRGGPAGALGRPLPAPTPAARAASPPGPRDLVRPSGPLHGVVDAQVWPGADEPLTGRPFLTLVCEAAGYPSAATSTSRPMIRLVGLSAPSCGGWTGAAGRWPGRARGAALDDAECRRPSSAPPSRAAGGRAAASPVARSAPSAGGPRPH